MTMADTTKQVLRAMAPGVAVGLALRFVPGPAGEWIARTLVFAACGAILALSWWMWRRTREMVATAREARVLTERLRAISDERDRYREAALTSDSDAEREALDEVRALATVPRSPPS